LLSDVTLQWRIWNNGSLAAEGYKCDTAYLSEDNEWDITDHQLGRSVCSFISIPSEAGSSMQQRGQSYGATRSTPFVAQENYSCIVRTRTNIRDPNILNNIGASTIPLRVNAPTLLLDVKTNLSIIPGRDVVYKIENIPSERTLIARLTTMENSRFHDLLLRHRKPPTGSVHDAFSMQTLSHNQTAVVQSTKPGTYYIRIESFGRSREPLQVEVKVAIFEITNIDPNFVAPLGNVTLRISGTLISNEVKAILVNENASVIITAHSLYWFSSIEVYATFDIENVPTGDYSVQLTHAKTHQQATLTDQFRITSGIPGQISTRIDAPRNLLRGGSTIVTLFVQNTGNTDVLTPIMFIRSNRQVQLSITDSNGQTNNRYASELIFLPVPLRGPPGIIRPGVTTKTLFHVLPNSFEVSFSVILSVSFLDENQKDFAHSYVERKQDLKPKEIHNDIWDIIWNSFLSSVGETWRTMIERFSSIANELSIGHKKIESVDELVDFQLRIAQGGQGPLGKDALYSSLTEHDSFCNHVNSDQKRLHNYYEDNTFISFAYYRAYHDFFRRYRRLQHRYGFSDKNCTAVFFIYSQAQNSRSNRKRLDCTHFVSNFPS
jgi:hypothetical protein